VGRSKPKNLWYCGILLWSDREQRIAYPRFADVVLVLAEFFMLGLGSCYPRCCHLVTSPTKGRIHSYKHLSPPKFPNALKGCSVNFDRIFDPINTYQMQLPSRVFCWPHLGRIWGEKLHIVVGVKLVSSIWDVFVPQREWEEAVLV